MRVLDELRGFKLGRWVNEIAEKVGASERTVRRDLAELQDSGFDIEITKRANRVYACLEGEQSSTVARDSFFLAALPAYEAARRLAPLDETYWVESGLTFDSLNRFEEAEWMFDEAFRLDPKSPPIRRYYAAHLEKWAGKTVPEGTHPDQPAG
jgi:DNA-binding Lrp family transcriptional regulator